MSRKDAPVVELGRPIAPSVSPMGVAPVTAPRAQAPVERRDIRVLQRTPGDGVIYQAPDGTLGFVNPSYSTSDPAQVEAIFQEYRKNPQKDPLAELYRPATTGEKAVGVGETALTIGSGLGGEIAGGLGGLLSLPFVGPESAAGVVESVSGAMQYEPRTRAGQQMTAATGEFFEPLARGLEAAGQFTGDVAYEAAGESPLAGALGYTAPTAVLEALGLGGLRAARSSISLLDDAGNPTPELRNLLNEQGLTYEALTPEVRASIPAEIQPGMIPGGETARTGTEVVRRELEAGGGQAGLAGRRLEGSAVARDPVAASAIRQGFEPGFVQTVKTATPETRADMVRMLQAMEGIKKETRLAGKIRPSDIAGQAVVQRVKFIRDKATEARRELDDIAKNRLAGRPIDPRPITDLVYRNLDEMNVKVTGVTPTGKPILDFSDSTILKNRPARKAIEDALDLLEQGGTPDALRFHQLKRQIDELISYKKMPQQGLTPTGQAFLKDLRGALNQQLRAIDPDYARVNDVLSRSLDLFDDLQTSAGARVDIFAPDADKLVGQQLRRLFSNTQARVGMESTVAKLDDFAKELGGTFNNNAYDLAIFATHLDKRFGAVAETSLQGTIDSALKRSAQVVAEGPTQTLFGAVADLTQRGFNRARGVNDFNAFRTMEELLKQGQ